MSREPKFRALDKKKNKIFPCTAVYDDFSCRVQDGATNRLLLAKDCELMQRTGLKDKDGKEIYWGDILSQISSEEEELIHVVGYEKYEARFVAYFKSSYNLDRSYCGLVARWTDEKEVVGNIYENPELLKEAK